MNQVLVFDGKAVQVEDDISKIFPVHSALSWVEDPSGLVKAGWSYDGTTFTPPPPVPVNPAAHSVATNVHGLGTNVNVLGNRDASAEFVQRGVLNPANLLAGGNTIYIGGASTVIFAVAFSSSPKVSPGGTTDNQIESAFCFNITTTAFTYRPFGTSASQVNTNGQYIALGA